MQRKIWQFKAPGTWIELDDFLENPAADGSMMKELELAGYNSVPSQRYGAEMTEFYCEIYTQPWGSDKKVPFTYIAQLEIGSAVETVVLEKLPDLVEFLSKVALISELSLRGNERHDEQLAGA